LPYGGSATIPLAEMPNKCVIIWKFQQDFVSLQVSIKFKKIHLLNKRNENKKSLD